MSHSEKVCRVGAAVLSPIIIIFIIATALGAVFGIIWSLEHLFPTAADSPPAHLSPLPAEIMMGLIAVAVTTMMAFAIYPSLYRHCRGAEFLAKFEALDQEWTALNKEHEEKIATLNKRKQELMRSGRDGAQAKAL